jgi:ankyrin repeat protein
LFAAIRRGDAAEVRGALAAGADPNGRDDSGTPALARAAMYGPLNMLAQLLDSGADVNASDTNGATALMWSGAQTAKLRYLMDRGANANIRMSDGSTALVAAARFGNVDGMRLLLERRADANASSGGAGDLLRIAYASADSRMVRALAEVGIRLSDPGHLQPGALITNVENVQALSALLAVGLSPDEQLRIATVTVPAVSIAAHNRTKTAMRLLLDRGGNPNVRGAHGLTPLMFAAASSLPDEDTVRSLIQRGADVRLTDDHGRTALDWALMHREPTVVNALRAAGSVSSAVPPAPAPVASPRTAAAAVEGALARLQPAGPTWVERAKCISCHHHSLPAIAVKVAGDRGLAVDRELARHPAEATLRGWRAQERAWQTGRVVNVPAFLAATTYGLFALAEEGFPSNSTTDIVALRLAAFQAPDGSWQGGSRDLRPPLDGSPITRTALAIRGLTAFAPPGRADISGQIARARAFLAASTPRDTEDEAYKLTGLVWSSAADDVIRRQRSRLLAMQRPDGGWGQLPQMASDAYATGQTLYALGIAGIRPDHPGYQHGARFLLRTQLEDGTWFVRSRAIGIQRYFESGFPHGRNQFISAAATSWAAIALAYTLDKR